jgi:hypothetical protein
LPHIVLLLLFFPAISFGAQFYERLGVIVATPALTTLVLSTIYAFIGGVRRRKSVMPLAFGAALLTSLLPIAGSLVVSRGLAELGLSISLTLLVAATITISVFAGVFVFGAYLALLTALGYEHTQAFTALDHPGFKHFLRLRVRADGSGIDGYCMGIADPLGESQEPVLVDIFQWRPRPSEHG